MAVELNIVTRSKRVPWIEDLAIEGPDYTGGTFRMELRVDPGDAGSALITLTNATAGSQGISCVYDPDYADPLNGDPFPASVLTFQIDEATMEGLAASTPSRAAVTLHYDIHITPSGGTKFLLMFGAFVYYPGVTL